jgi:Flp pilus assembly pilin Flp
MRRLWREEHGAVAVEFAILMPFMLLIIVGFFGVGVLLIQYQQLNFAVQGAAFAEAQSAGSGVAFASSQISGAQFTATLVPPKPPVPSYACISGQLPVTPVLWQTLTLSAQACSPVPAAHP